MLHETRQNILIIEADVSLRRLITLGLEYRGMRVSEAPSISTLPALEDYPPDLIVLDIDNNTDSNSELLSAVRTHPRFSTLPLVILVWDDVFPMSEQTPAQGIQATYLSKPFDARTLHATIEGMLAARREVVIAKQREALLTTRFVYPTPSICPLVTAAALLLTVIGLMVQLALAGVGILIVLAALLWWTLGKKPESETTSSPELHKTYSTSMP